jgi:hypothetical protein
LSSITDTSKFPADLSYKRVYYRNKKNIFMVIDNDSDNFPGRESGCVRERLFRGEMPFRKGVVMEMVNGFPVTELPPEVGK